MKVLVTGAAGFLGRHVVRRLCERGHEVRALLRPASADASLPSGLEIIRADLRAEGSLAPLFEGVDAVVHLAAAVGVDEDSMFASTVIGTERLLQAMARSSARRLVLASSLVVYDWSLAQGTLDETTPLASNVYARGPYDVSKLWQERVVLRAAARHRFALTILRPGFIWGPGREAIAGMGRVFGPVRLLIGPATRLPLTHVENCADCFVAAMESPAAVGRVFNVIDGDGVRAWRYLREYARGTGHRGLTVPIPYAAASGLAALATATSRALFGPKGRLPSLLSQPRFEAQFKPLRYSTRALRDELGWIPPLPFETCLQRTYGARP